MSIGKRIVPRPTSDFAAASERFATLAALDDASIAATGRSRFFENGRRAPIAVVLLHGLTNAPEQWVPFAGELRARGHNVVVPRLPGHGEIDRETKALARVPLAAYLATTSEAIDIARGSGASVVVVGISIGGAFAAWQALRRDDVARAIAIAPLFGIRRLPVFANRLVAGALGTLPNAFVPWDPRGDGSQIPAYGYPRFATHALARTLRIGLDVERRSHRAVARGEILAVLNAAEPACENSIAETIVARLARARAGSARTIVWSDVPPMHDIVDPTNPHGRTDIVYPRLLAEIER